MLETLPSRSEAIEPTVDALSRTIEDLQSQLQQLQSETQLLRRRYKATCLVALRRALIGLLALSDSVLEADHHLILWYAQEQSHARHGHRILHGNRKEWPSIHAIVARQTSMLSGKVDTAGAGFAVSAELCAETLADVQNLNRRVNDFAKTSIGRAQDDVSRALERLERERSELRKQIAAKKLEVVRVDGDIDEKVKELERIEKESSGAETAAKESHDVGSTLR